jgi:ketosteroid isomerase-like protein
MPSALEDKDAIRELMARYCFHFDGAEFEEWLRLFTDDGVFDVLNFGRFAGREQLRQFLHSIPLKDGSPMMKHCVMNEIVSVSGDVATAQSYVVVVRGGERVDLGVAGRYQDRLRRANGQWLFAERRAYLDFMNRY